MLSVAMYKSEAAYRERLRREVDSHLGQLLHNLPEGWVITYLGELDGLYVYSVVFTHPRVWHVEYSQGMAHAFLRRDYSAPGCVRELPARPSIIQVVRALVHDARAVGNFTNFEDWADDYGYEKDSRAAYRVWEKCVESLRMLPLATNQRFSDLARAVEEDEDGGF